MPVMMGIITLHTQADCRWVQVTERPPGQQAQEQQQHLPSCQQAGAEGAPAQRRKVRRGARQQAHHHSGPGMGCGHARCVTIMQQLLLQRCGPESKGGQRITGKLHSESSAMHLQMPAFRLVRSYR